MNEEYTVIYATLNRQMLFYPGKNVAWARARFAPYYLVYAEVEQVDGVLGVVVEVIG